MSNYIIIWNHWIFRDAKGAASVRFAGHTADELAAFERAMAKPLPFA